MWAQCTVELLTKQSVNGGPVKTVKDFVVSCVPADKCTDSEPSPLPTSLSCLRARGLLPFASYCDL